MSGRLFVDRLIDRIMSAGVPAPRGAKMAAYQPTGDQADLAELMGAHARAWRSFGYQGDDDRSALARKIAERAGARIGLATTSTFADPFCKAASGLMAAEPGFFPFSFAANISTLSLLQAAQVAV
ncbi:MAG: hypothetical protein IIB62_12940 [Proteobacteria bacterium]|nr:hypothetical protein [Pseudomonadota bacterium]